jgi:hypothetical protein
MGSNEQFSGRKSNGNESKSRFGLFGHFVEDAEPLPEEAAAGGGEPAHFAGEGEILAGEAGPDDIATGDFGAAHVLDGAEVEVVGAVVGLVDGGFFGADVVGPDGGAGVLRAPRDNTTASEEIDEVWRGLDHAFIKIAWNMFVKELF